MATSKSNEQLLLSNMQTKITAAKSVVFVSGNFNVVHPGHLRLLRFASECGDCLVVGINADSSQGVTLPEDLRLQGIEAISLVDCAFILRASPSEYILNLKPDVVVKGKEFESRLNLEKDALDSYGGKLLFSSGEESFSSLGLLHREYIETTYATIRKPSKQFARYNFSPLELKNALDKINGLKVLVIGDLIVDEYITCEPLGMSHEDPTIVVTPIESKRFVGGAGIVAAHASGLGGNVQYISVAGNDEAAVYAEEKLSNYGIVSHIIRDDSRPTTIKKRFRAAGKTLLRVSELRQHAISKDIASKILSATRRVMMDCDIVIFSDFNYGCLPQELIDEIITNGKNQGVRMVADSQASSQVSDISRFNGMSILTPTEREARLAIRDTGCGLAVLAERLAEKSKAENIVITLGTEGLLIITKDEDTGEWATDVLPAFNTSPKDVAGAGDSFLACASMIHCSENDIWKSAYLASIAAGCQVSRVGNTPLTQQDLLEVIEFF